MRTAALLLSYLLHPSIMPLVTLWVLLQLDPRIGYFLPPSSRYLVLGMVALMTVVFPLTSTLLLRRAGLITDLQLPRREERIAPYLLMLLYLGLTLYLLLRTPLHPIVHGLFTGIMLSVLITLIITLRWKISAHMVGMGGLIGALFAIQYAHGIPIFMPLIVAILLAGLVATSRLITSDHSHGQIHAGALLGGSCTFLGMLWPMFR